MTDGMTAHELTVLVEAIRDNERLRIQTEQLLQQVAELTEQITELREQLAAKG